MYVDKVLNDKFWANEFKQAAERTRLDTLATTATRMCQMYMGLGDKITWCNGADEDLASRLLDNLFRSGNFGRKLAEGGHVEKVGTAIKREGLFRYLQRAGEYNWKMYRTHRWLKPFCWLYQIGRYLRQGIKARRAREMFRDFQQSTDRYELLKELGI